MSCILRVSGIDLDLIELLKSSIVPNSTWKKETPRISDRPDGKKYSSSGARYMVSEADFGEFELQKSDAIRFLERNQKNIEKIMNLPGVEDAVLDLGI